VASGQTLKVTAEVDGVPTPNVTWTVLPSTTPPIIDGATVTVRADVPGQAIQVSARSTDDSTIVNEVIGEVVPPGCMKTWPPLRPLRLGFLIRNRLRIPVAVRHDGSPVLATVIGTLDSEDTLDVMAWDGQDWSDGAAPIDVSGAPFVDASDSPVALTLDGQDRPLVGFQGSRGIEVRRAQDGVWQSFGAPLSAVVQGDLVLAV